MMGRLNHDQGQLFYSCSRASTRAFFAVVFDHSLLRVTAPSVTPQIKREFKRYAAIEPVIDHLKPTEQERFAQTPSCQSKPTAPNGAAPVI
jgi:hypothetical protein